MIKTRNSNRTSRTRKRARGGAAAGGIAKRRRESPYVPGQAGSAGFAFPGGFAPEGRTTSTRNFRHSFR